MLGAHRTQDSGDSDDKQAAQGQRRERGRQGCPAARYGQGGEHTALTSRRRRVRQGSPPETAPGHRRLDEKE